MGKAIRSPFTKFEGGLREAKLENDCANCSIELGVNQKISLDPRFFGGHSFAELSLLDRDSGDAQLIVIDNSGEYGIEQIIPGIIKPGEEITLSLPTPAGLVELVVKYTQ